MQKFCLPYPFIREVRAPLVVVNSIVMSRTLLLWCGKTSSWVSGKVNYLVLRSAGDFVLVYAQIWIQFVIRAWSRITKNIFILKTHNILIIDMFKKLLLGFMLLPLLARAQKGDVNIKNLLENKNSLIATRS